MTSIRFMTKVLDFLSNKPSTTAPPLWDWKLKKKLHSSDLIAIHLSTFCPNPQMRFHDFAFLK